MMINLGKREREKKGGRERITERFSLKERLWNRGQVKVNILAIFVSL